MLFAEAGCKGLSDERQGRVGWFSAMGQSDDECHSEAGVGIHLLGENREKLRRLVGNATCDQHLFAGFLETAHPVDGVLHLLCPGSRPGDTAYSDVNRTPIRFEVGQRSDSKRTVFLQSPHDPAQSRGDPEVGSKKFVSIVRTDSFTVFLGGKTFAFIAIRLVNRRNATWAFQGLQAGKWWNP